MPMNEHGSCFQSIPSRNNIAANNVNDYVLRIHVQNWRAGSKVYFWYRWGTGSPAGEADRHSLHSRGSWLFVPHDTDGAGVSRHFSSQPEAWKLQFVTLSCILLLAMLTSFPWIWAVFLVRPACSSSLFFFFFFYLSVWFIQRRYSLLYTTCSSCVPLNLIQFIHCLVTNEGVVHLYNGIALSHKKE